MGFENAFKYGAVASVGLLAMALGATLVGGPFSVLGAMVGPITALGSFYFVGSSLYVDTEYRVLGEELLRGIVWYGIALFGWAGIINASPSVPASAWTVLWLSLMTALGVSLLCVGIRTQTPLKI